MHLYMYGSFSFVGSKSNKRERTFCPTASGSTFTAMQSNNAKDNQHQGKKRASRKRNENGEGAVHKRDAD